MKLVLFASLVIFVSILPKYSQQTFWRHPTLPSNPNAPIYQKLQQIPSPKKTAQKILDNFVRYHPGQNGKRTGFQEDTVIVIDGSGSIGSCEFREGRKAMLAMMKMCSEKPEGTSCRYAGVTFASSATRNFNYLSIAEASRKMSAVSYPGGGTNTKAGLEEAERIIRAGARSWARKMIFLVTDGQSNDRQATLDSAKRIKNSIPGLEIFVVAVGSYVNGIDEMANVASYPPLNHVYRVEKVSDLQYVFELALKEMNPKKYTAVKPTRLCN